MSGSTTDVGVIVRQQQSRFDEALRPAQGARQDFAGDERQLYLMWLELRATEFRLRENRRQHPYQTVYVGGPAGPRQLRLRRSSS
jgi:hypothetical protein